MADLNIQRDARVMASDGEVGRVTHVVVDPGTKEVTHLVVERDGNEHEVPMSAVSKVEGDKVMLTGNRAAFGTRFERDRYHGVDEDDVREETTRQAQRGGAPLVDAKEDQVEVGGARPAAQPRAQATPPRGDRAAMTNQPGRLQLREERLTVSKEQEEIGEVRLGKRVTEHTETVNVPVREERVVIERTPGTGKAVAGDMELKEGESIEVDVMAERVNVEKEAVVAEEVNVRKEVTERQERVSETVRKEELVVEGDERLIAGNGNTTPAEGSAAERAARAAQR